MKTLRELTRRIARIVDALLGRVSNVERELALQERRLSAIEEETRSDLHSREVEHEELRAAEENRQSKLSENELRQELQVQYGSTAWARNLIRDIMSSRKGTGAGH